MKRFLVIVAMITAMIIAPVAMGSGNTTISVNPGTPTLGSTFTVTSCGYSRSSKVMIIAFRPDGSFQFANDIVPNSSGCASAQFVADMRDFTIHNPDGTTTVNTLWTARAGKEDANGAMQKNYVDVSFTVN